jgi:hypothetical protein
VVVALAGAQGVERRPLELGRVDGVLVAQPQPEGALARLDDALLGARKVEDLARPRDRDREMLARGVGGPVGPERLEKHVLGHRARALRQ